MCRILFLTNNVNTESLYNWLCANNSYVFRSKEKLTEETIDKYNPDIVICYNYRYIISSEVIKKMSGNIVNLHISYLPWNRGANPNFWSFVDDTPKGVTIHYIDEELDKGSIIAQKQIDFDEKDETFESTYSKLNTEIVELFKCNWENIKNKTVNYSKTEEKGSYHNMEEFLKIKKEIGFSWDENIADFLERYRKNE